MSKEDYEKLKIIAREIELIKDKYNFIGITIESQEFTDKDLKIMIRAKCYDDFKYIVLGYKDDYEEMRKVCDKSNCNMKGYWC